MSSLVIYVLSISVTFTEIAITFLANPKHRTVFLLWDIVRAHSMKLLAEVYIEMKLKKVLKNDSLIIGINNQTSALKRSI